MADADYASLHLRMLRDGEAYADAIRAGWEAEHPDGSAAGAARALAVEMCRYWGYDPDEIVLGDGYYNDRPAVTSHKRLITLNWVTPRPLWAAFLDEAWAALKVREAETSAHAA